MAPADEGFIPFTPKELFQSIDGKLDTLNSRLDTMNITLQNEIRDVRHRVAQIETQHELRKQLDTEIREAIKGFRKFDPDEYDNLLKDMENIKVIAASEKEVKSFTNLVKGLAVGFAVNFVMNVYQLMQTGGR